jgi:hypothetical protein
MVSGGPFFSGARIATPQGAARPEVSVGALWALGTASPVKPRTRGHPGLPSF